MKVFKVVVYAKPVIQIVGLSKISASEQTKVISDVKREFDIDYAEQTPDTYIGYKRHARLQSIGHREAKNKEL